MEGYILESDGYNCTGVYVLVPSTDLKKNVVIIFTVLGGLHYRY